MKGAESVLLSGVVGLAWFVGGQIVALQGATPDAYLAPSAAAVVAARSTASRARSEPSTVRDPRLPSLALRQRIAQGDAGTYIDEILASRDSALTRWPDRTTRPLRVFLSAGDTLDGWRPEFLPAVRDAFDTWVATGIPVRFTYVLDSASADVQVRFEARLPGNISGRTVWTRDAAHWMLTGAVQLAIAHPSGGIVNGPQMRAIALHEVGHLLGLDHTREPDHIMSPRVRVRDLSLADRSTVRLLYSVPAGTLRSAEAALVMESTR